MARQRFNPQHAARALARRLAVQALYRWQLNPGPWQDVVAEFSTDPDMARADAGYFRALIEAATTRGEEIDAAYAPFLSRPAATLDPLEHAVLLVAAVELREQPQVPYRVAIDEAVGLARRYGATDAHQFVNGVLDRAARDWRAQER